MTAPNAQDQWYAAQLAWVSCRFTPQGFDVKVSAVSTGACGTNAPATNLTNFLYEIDMTIVSGLTQVTRSTHGAGLQFRYTNNPDGLTNTNYGLSFQQDGTYDLFAYDRGTLLDLSKGRCASFQTGIRKENLLDVEMHGPTMVIFVNGVYLTTATDTRFTSGQLGIQIASGNTASEVLYSNLKVWRF